MSKEDKEMFSELFRYLNRDMVKGGLEDFNIQIYSVTDFEDIPEKPGLYSWHLYMNRLNGDRIKQYNKFYRFNEYKVTLEGSLNEMIKGDANGVTSQRFQKRSISLDREDKPLNKKLLGLSTIIFNPPLYIGRSNKLRTRLKKHFDHFDDHFDQDLEELSKKKYADRVSIYNEEEIEERLKNGESITDNDDESSFFGQRLGYYLTKCQGENDTVINKNNLFVFVINLKDESKIDEVDFNEIEYILNRSFTPLLGRK